MDKASGFLLCALSPVWRAKLCGDIGGETRGQLALDGGEARLFSKLVALGAGAPVAVEGGLEEVIALGLMADRFQVESVQEAVEGAALRLMTVESCGLALEWSSGSGLARVARASRELALREFREFAMTAGFVQMGEGTLGSLLDDDDLTIGSEEAVLEAVLRWMEGGGAGGGARGEGLLARVRFPFMDEAYLAGLLLRAPRLEPAGLATLVAEALALRALPRRDWGHRRQHLDERALARRGGAAAVDWADSDCAGGGGRRLAAGQYVYSVAVHGGHVCAGLGDGGILVGGRSTLERERTLEGHRDAVWALLSAGGRLFSGADDGGIRVWDVAAGRCEGELRGHAGDVTALAAAGGGRLVSGGWDGTVRVWGPSGEAAPGWRAERVLADGGRASVLCLAAWGGRVAGGSSDGAIRVWSAETWALERTLRGHAGAVHGLAAGASLARLFSSSADGTVRAWSTETWACARAAEAYPAGSPRHVFRLAVSGRALVGGSTGSDSDEPEVRVWDAETLRPLHTLRQPAGGEVMSLVAGEDGVWAAAGRQVVVWGARD